MSHWLTKSKLIYWPRILCRSTITAHTPMTDTDEKLFTAILQFSQAQCDYAIEKMSNLPQRRQ